MTSAIPVADRLAIHELLARYAWALDTGDLDALVACFTPDAVVIEQVFEDPDRWEGHVGIRRLGQHYFSAPGFPGRQHHVTQVLIDGDDSLARVRAFTFVTECRGEPPFVLRFAGYYEDQVVKRHGEWLFTQRVIRLWDGQVLARFPGHGEYKPRKRPAELQVRR
jgi:ketosteroid isomerase-like protein